MLETIGKKLGTKPCHLSGLLYGCNLNSPKVVKDSDCIVKPFRICREEVGFFEYSKLGNTHNPNTQGGLELCLCM